MTSASAILRDDVKTEPMDTDINLTAETQEGNNTWVKVKDISLTNNDKNLLVHGEKLTDKHMNLAHRILKLNFPNINGLRLTLLQDKAHKEPTDNALQIFHTGDDHWVCATTIGTSGKKVLVYDSAYTRWDDAAVCLLKRQFRCSASNITIVKGVQKQLGDKECGLYAIANATSVAFGKDPSKMAYQESVMREHLYQCFSRETLEVFPTA